MINLILTITAPNLPPRKPSKTKNPKNKKTTFLILMTTNRNPTANFLSSIRNPPKMWPTFLVTRIPSLPKTSTTTMRRYTRKLRKLTVPKRTIKKNKLRKATSMKTLKKLNKANPKIKAAYPRELAIIPKATNNSSSTKKLKK